MSIDLWPFVCVIDTANTTILMSVHVNSDITMYGWRYTVLISLQYSILNCIKCCY